MVSEEAAEKAPMGARQTARNFSATATPNTITNEAATATPATISDEAPVAFATHSEMTRARLRMLRRLASDHDRDGAKAADHDSVDRAIAFVGSARFDVFPVATLSDEGEAVLEMADAESGFFADITFTLDGQVECYCRRPAARSKLVMGSLDDLDIRCFLEEQAGVRVD